MWKNMGKGGGKCKEVEKDKDAEACGKCFGCIKEKKWTSAISRYYKSTKQ
jgi:hypothetical protein